MSHKLAAAAAIALILGPAAARATDMSGSFSGTIGTGTDTTGVFGTPGAVLDGDPVTGTFVYDTSLFSQAVAGSTNTATGTGLGALTVTLTINDVSHIFTDNTSSSIFLDDAASEVTYQTDDTSGGGGSNLAENFFLDVEDPITPFVPSTNLTDGYTTTDPFSSNGSFAIVDTGPNAQASGSFTLGTLTVAQEAVPEPVSGSLLVVGLAGLAAARRRRRAG
jgi:hypothetical protein